MKNKTIMFDNEPIKYIELHAGILLGNVNKKDIVNY